MNEENETTGAAPVAPSNESTASDQGAPVEHPTTAPAEETVAPVEQPAPAVPEAPAEEVSPESIGKEMSEAEGAAADTAAKGDAPVAEEPVELDITKLAPEQLQHLKAALDAVPQGLIKSAKKISTVTLRKLHGKMVVDFSNAFQKHVKDPEARVDRLRQHITVQYHGEEEKETVLYAEFMTSERVTCEVVKNVTDPKEKQVGVVYSRQLKRKVPMMVNWVETIFTVKLPDGETLDINATKVNQ